MSAVVTKLERSSPDLEPIRTLDETSPVRAAAEFAVGHNLKANLLLQSDNLADTLVLQLREFSAADLPSGMLAESLA